jgi:hypothetical protein
MSQVQAGRNMEDGVIAIFTIEFWRKFRMVTKLVNFSNLPIPTIPAIWHLSHESKNGELHNCRHCDENGESGEISL